MRRNLLYVSSIGEDCCAAAQDFHVGIEIGIQTRNRVAAFRFAGITLRRDHDAQ